MNLLAFDTGTETLSIAVCRTVDGATQHWQHTAAGGAKASSDLIPAILDLLQRAGLHLRELDAVCFGSGPGSFTGLRTACSVAQGLAFGAKVPVLPVDSLLAVAEDARHTALGQQQNGAVTALLDARMDEVYAATYGFDAGQWSVLHPCELVRPEDVLQQPPTTTLTTDTGVMAAMAPPRVLAGNVFAVYGDRVAAHDPAGAQALRLNASPTAMAMLRLAPQLLAAGLAVAAEHAMPIYVRDKVAKTTVERAAEKAALQAARGA